MKKIELEIYKGKAFDNSEYSPVMVDIPMSVKALRMTLFIEPDKREDLFAFLKLNKRIKIILVGVKAAKY